MRSNLVVAATILLWLSLNGCSQMRKDYMKMIEGTWIPVEAELGGQPFPEAILKSMRLDIKDGAYVVHVGEKLDKGTVAVETRSNPLAMDIAGIEGPNEGKTFLAIWDLQGDKLRICYDLTGKQRPAEFKTAKDTQQFLVKYNRSTI